MIALSAALLNILATVYPAIKASRVVPADELRYDN
jgi:lipoprotein-releasing system permease protein